ncbi:MAG: heparinase II/III family protein [Chloroflexi bacterium]|nr:heparinase II/III family protein [Chloroflexota bacterium]
MTILPTTLDGEALHVRLGLYVRYALSLPPRGVARKAIGLLLRELAALAQRQRDARRSTRVAPAAVPRGALYAYFRPVPLELLAPRAGQIAALAELYLGHRFDLLGSGWVQVRHGMVCRGLEGCRYAMGGPVQADRAGRWLEGRVQPANLAESRRLWGLVDAGYVPIDWHLDFKSGYRWAEATWYRDIPYGHRPGVDIKVPWELARMQHLPMLAWAYALASAGQDGFRAPQVYARELRNQVLDFMATNPPRFGVHWRSTMDVAIRAANWLAGFDLFRAYGAEFDAPFEAELARGVYEHARHIVANLEWDPSLRGNHYLADVVGLLFAAAYLPRSPETDAWLAFAVQELAREVGHQFTPDGANFEASTGYHRLAAELVVYGTALALGLGPDKQAALQEYDHRRHTARPGLEPAPLRLAPLPGCDRALPFPAWYVERLEKMAEFSLHLTKPHGRVLQVGDNDSGRCLKLQPAFQPTTVAQARARYANLEGYADLPDAATCWVADDLDHRHLVAAINGLFGRDDLAAFARDSRLETEVVRGLAGSVRLPSYRGNGEPTAAERVRIGTEAAWAQLASQLSALPEGQRQVLDLPAPGGDLRAGLRLYAYPDFGLYLYRSTRLHLAVRCGPGARNGTGCHAHHDQLALELTVDGQDWITDPGTYLYTPLPERRNEYRGASAHWAPRVEGREPGRLDQGLFRLADEARAECLWAGPDRFAGRHRGYGPPVYRFVEILADRVRVMDYAEGDLPLARLPARGVHAPALSPAYGVRHQGEPAPP